MEMTGEKLIEMFYTSMTDDKIVEIIDTLGLEQPILDEEYELYKSVSTKDTNGIGIDFTFSELETCKEDGIPCMNIISWDDDKNVKPPFGLSISLSYDECCQVLHKNADYLNQRIKKLKIWLITYNNTKYKIAIMFKDMDFMQIRSIVITPYTKASIKDSYIQNKD